MATVSFEGVAKTYNGEVQALVDFTLGIEDGEFMVFVGPSGCGKTTALRMVAGLEEVTEGNIRIGDMVVNDLEPRERDVAMVFQNYALYPHMTVFDNIAFGLRLRKVEKEERRRRVEEVARVLGLSDLLRRRPRTLSGGQRQRVAMGRALVRDPRVFLLDEPLSNLDARLRVQMRVEIARIQRELDVTTIYVTHDQVEAMTMGDRVAVVRKGELQQVDAPQRLYDAPKNLFVASFIGSPAINLVQAEVWQDAEGWGCRVGDQAIALSRDVFERRPALARYAGRRVALGIRPEHLHDAAREGIRREQRLVGEVELAEGLGSELLVHGHFEAEPVATAEVLEVAGDVDASLLEDIRSEARERRTPFVARFDVRSAVRPGERVEMRLDPANAHFFDLETGLAISS